MVKVFAPVNIAWIKYMGKENGNPTNSSLSMTLDQVGTHTSIERVSAAGELAFEWNIAGYVPPMSGRQKAENFLRRTKHWTESLSTLGFSTSAPVGTFRITTFNNVPAGTGIATSASGFAALTLAWIGILLESRITEWQDLFEQSAKHRIAVAEIAKLGSGSAGRSIDGPWVEWDPRLGIHRIEGGKISFTDFILIIDTETKAVSSSDAHARVLSSPLFLGRVGRAEARLAQVKSALLRGDLKVLSARVLEEALDMHDLFHTSEPSFSYLKPQSKFWIERVKNHDPLLPTQNCILTLDAGANVHLFVPSHEEAQWEAWLRTSESGVSFVKARAGKGAHYVR